MMFMIGRSSRGRPQLCDHVRGQHTYVDVGNYRASGSQEDYGTYPRPSFLDDF
jgi:hypothetical protein